MDLHLTWRYPNCPSVWDLSNKQHHIHTMKYYAAMEKGQGQSLCHSDGISLKQNEVKQGKLENHV